MVEGSQYFRRLVKDCADMSTHIHFKRIKFGFYRVYWTGGGEPAYIHEVCKDMTLIGYDIMDEDPRFENKKYYEEFEDKAELTMKIKNYREGYWDSFRTIQKRIYLLKNSDEHYKESVRAYRNVRVR